jgi:hypothetical protein
VVCHRNRRKKHQLTGRNQARSNQIKLNQTKSNQMKTPPAGNPSNVTHIILLAFRVSKLVNNARNDSPDYIKPAQALKL